MSDGEEYAEERNRRRATAESGTALPDGRVAAGVEDGDDLDPIRLRPVVDAVREPPHHCSADVGEHLLVNQRIGRDAVEHPLHFGYKLCSQSGAPRFVPVERLVKLRFRLGAEDDGEAHFRALSSARALMTSQGVTASGRAILSASSCSSSAR